MQDLTRAVTRLIELSNEYVELASVHLRRNWDISTTSQLQGFGGIQEFHEALRLQLFFPELPTNLRKLLMDLRRAKFECDAAREPYREPLTREDVTAAAKDLSGSTRSFLRAVAEAKAQVLPLLTPVQQEILRKLYFAAESRVQTDGR